MKRQTKVAVLLCAVVLVFAIGYVLIFALSRRPYGAVRVGMTPDQVRKLLGNPKSTDSPFSLRRSDEFNSPPFFTWSTDGILWTEEWDDFMGTVTITYLNGRVTDVTRFTWKDKLAIQSPWWSPF
jgi:hypothetical protein